MRLDYCSVGNKTRDTDCTNYKLFIQQAKACLVEDAFVHLTLEPGDATHYGLTVANVGGLLWVGRPERSNQALVVQYNEWVDPERVAGVAPFNNPCTARLVAQLVNDLTGLTDEDSVLSFDFLGTGRAVFE